MEHTQLVELIKTLSAEEKTQLQQVAAAAFFGTSKLKPNIGPLLQICLDHPWQEQSQKLEKETLFLALFPDQPYSEGKLEKLMVEAQKVTKAFLLHQHYFREENEFHQTLDFAEIARLRGLTNRFNNSVVRLKKLSSENAKHHALYFHDQFCLEYAIHIEASKQNQVKGDLNIPQVLDALDMHQALNNTAFLNIYLLQLLAARVEVPEEMKFRLENTIVPKHQLEKSPALLINFTIFNLLKKNSYHEADINHLHNLLINYEPLLDSESVQGYYTYLRNICTLILLKEPDRKDINDKLFSLLLDNLERGYLHYEGKIHHSRYLGMSETAARAGELDWALEFIEKYKDEIIGENETRDIYRLNLALTWFAKGDFEKCIDLLPATSPFVTYQVAGKIVELKCLYELNSDLLPYKLDAFKMFLSRTSAKLLPLSRRQKHQEFLNLLVQIHASIPGDKKRADKLIERIKEKKQASEWRWLLSKAEALKTKKN